MHSIIAAINKLRPSRDVCSTAENKSRSVYRVECSDSFMNPINIRKTGTDLSLLPRCPHPPAENVWWLELDFYKLYNVSD